MVIGEGAVVDHGRYVGVLMVVRSVVIAVGVGYDRKTLQERSQPAQHYSITQVKGSSMLMVY